MKHDHTQPQRQEKYRKSQEKKGMITFRRWVTEAEYKKLEDFLKKIRKGGLIK